MILFFSADILRLIFSFLTGIELVRLRLVCKTLNNVSSNRNCWRVHQFHNGKHIVKIDFERASSSVELNANVQQYVCYSKIDFSHIQFIAIDKLDTSHELIYDEIQRIMVSISDIDKKAECMALLRDIAIHPAIILNKSQYVPYVHIISSLIRIPDISEMTVKELKITDILAKHASLMNSDSFLKRKILVMTSKQRYGTLKNHVSKMIKLESGKIMSSNGFKFTEDVIMCKQSITFTYYDSNVNYSYFTHIYLFEPFVLRGRFWYCEPGPIREIFLITSGGALEEFWIEKLKRGWERINIKLCLEEESVFRHAFEHLHFLKTRTILLDMVNQAQNDKNQYMMEIAMEFEKSQEM